jgi:iron complex transport system ATP-binding protein
VTPAVETSALCVRVGAKALLEKISLAIAPAETVALVGPNGAGKSTLMRVFSGEIGADAGTVKLKGRDPAAYGPRILALHRAVLSQNVTVTFPFTVAEIVRMGAGERRGTAVDRRADAALAEVDLDGFQDRIISTLSGGEQQRAHFARVLVQLACGEDTHGPGILLLDEPTASLDLRHQIDLVAAARRRAEGGTTVIAIVHDLNLAVRLAGRIVVLGGGRLAADGPPQATITEPVLRHVFGVAAAVGRLPEPTAPFVLPHGARKEDPEQPAART